MRIEKGDESTAVRAYLSPRRGKRVDLVLDKLAERLAFERQSVQLYDALAAKARGSETWSGGPTLEFIESFRQDEISHVDMIVEAIRTLGGDARVTTHSARLATLEVMGLSPILEDQETTLPQALHALLAAELIDNDGWQLLIEVTLAFGAGALANAFAEARYAEARHLDHVRIWLSNHAFGEGAGTRAATRAEPASRIASRGAAPHERSR